MRERGIQFEHVSATLIHPIQAHDTPQGSREFWGKIGDRVLKVWVVWPPENEDVYVVKSAAWRDDG